MGTETNNLYSDGRMKDRAIIFFNVLINLVYLSIFRKLW